MANFVNEANFKSEVLESDIPVLVDFFATWCGPCRMMSPVIDEISNDANGKYKVFKLDIDENEALAREYKIRSVPTFIVFDKGEEVERIIGVVDKDRLVEGLGK